MTDEPGTGEDPRAGVVAQFSDRGPRADVWRALDLVLPTDSYLNLGYSGRFQSHLVGSPQRRLIDRIAEELLAATGGSVEGPVLDVGCGRGGPADRLATRWGLEVVGVDLVPYNLQLARERVDADGASGGAASGIDGGGAATPAFVAGDATRLPFADDAFAACVGIDSLVYVPDSRGVFAELDRVLGPGGVCVLSDLVVADDAAVAPSTLRRFADRWDMPPLETLSATRDHARAAGLRVDRTVDLSSNSVRRFGKWSRALLALADGPTGPLLRRALGRLDLDAGTVVDQVRAAHDALPALRHVLLRVSARGADAGGDPVGSP